jgi:hypothetical protein
MTDIDYNLRQASTLTRYARLTRNPERAAHLLRVAEQHKKLADEAKLLFSNTEQSTPRPGQTTPTHVR